MKKNKKNQTAHRLEGFSRHTADLSKQATESSQSLADNSKGLTEFSHTPADISQPLAELRQGVTDIRQSFADIRESFPEPRELPAVAKKSKNKLNPIAAIILLALSRSDADYIPGADSDFDEWQKNYVKHLSSPWPVAEPGAPAAESLYKFLGIPEERYKEILEAQLVWDKDFARGGKESDRKESETIAKQITRDNYEHLLRSVTAEYIRSNRKASGEIKRALKLTVPDAEPSPSHGSHLSTLAPDVFLKTMGGGKIDARFKRPSDETRGSVPKGFEAELRYVVDMPLPPDPEDISVKTTILSTKARFQFEAGMVNLGKKLRSYARWRHKINPDFNSPWTLAMEITIA